MRLPFLVLATVACASPKPAPAPPAPTLSAPLPPPAPIDLGTNVIELQRTTCLGGCAAYRVAITTKGHVAYTGGSSVKQEGNATRWISQASVDALVTAFDDAGVAAFPPATRRTPLDAPTARLWFRGKEIEYSDGVRVIGSPELARTETVERLANEVDRAVDIDRWIGTEAEREAAWNAFRLEKARKVCEKRPPAEQADCYDDHAVTPP